MDPKIQSAEFYRDLGTWLKALGEYALLQADQLEGAANAPGKEPPVEDAPAHWLAALASVPPDHWLRLVKQASVTEWNSSEDFSPPALTMDASAKEPLPPGEGSGPSESSLSPLEAPPRQEPRSEIQTAEEPHVQVAPSSDPRLPWKPVASSAIESIPAEMRFPDEESHSLGRSEPAMKPPASLPEQAVLPQQQTLAQAAPMEPIPTRPVTRLRLRASQETNRDRSKPAAVQAAPLEPPTARRVNVPFRARIKPRQETVQTKAETDEEPPGSSSAETERKDRLIETRVSKQRVEQSPLSEARPLAEEAQAILSKPRVSSPPIYPPRPVTRPQPPRWPTTSAYWPDLPHGTLGSNADGEFDLDRQQRLDQEQQGRPWNA